MVSEPEITDSDKNFADTEYAKWERRHESQIEGLATTLKDCEAELKRFMAVKRATISGRARSMY